jgi:hypothetical protein
MVTGPQLPVNRLALFSYRISLAAAAASAQMASMKVVLIGSSCGLAKFALALYCVTSDWIAGDDDTSPPLIHGAQGPVRGIAPAP